MAESLIFGHDLCFLVPPEIAVPPTPSSFFDLEIVFLLLPVMFVLESDSSSNPSFMDHKLVFLLLRVLVFFGMPESSDSGLDLVKKMPLFRFTGDSSLSGGDTAPS
jgi:hypothetical protein